jgi:hypothetical protein
MAINTRSQRNRSEIFVDQTQIPLVVGNANFDFLGESSASEHPRVDIVDVVRGADGSRRPGLPRIRLGGS